MFRSCLLLISPSLCGGSAFGPCFVVQYIVLSGLLWFCHHLSREEKAGCFALIVFMVPCGYWCSVAFPHGDIVWSAVVIVVFPDHTHLLFWP